MANSPKQTKSPSTTKKAQAVTRKRAASRATVVPLSNVVSDIAAASGRDATKTGKLVRSYIRSNFDDMLKRWPMLRDAQKANRDGNRYPPMPSALATELVTRFSTKSAK